MSEQKGEEGKPSFEIYRACFQAQIQRALAHPISIDDYMFGEYLISLKPLDVASHDQKYLNGAVRLNYSDLALLDKEQLKQLMTDLKDQVTKNVPESQLQHHSWRYLFGEGPAGLVQHEMEHIEVLPQSIRDKAMIDLVFFRENENLRVNGLSLFDHSAMTDREWALCLSAPQSLGAADIKRAKAYASKTMDEFFIAETNDRIKARSHHGTYLYEN